MACRCLSCDTDLRAQRGMQQQGRRSPPPSKPSLLPKLLALDPNSAALYSTSQASDTGVHKVFAAALALVLRGGGGDYACMDMSAAACGGKEGGC